jgi:hypothetical protein
MAWYSVPNEVWLPFTFPDFDEDKHETPTEETDPGKARSAERIIVKKLPVETITNTSTPPQNDQSNSRRSEKTDVVQEKVNPVADIGPGERLSAKEAPVEVRTVNPAPPQNNQAKPKGFIPTLEVLSDARTKFSIKAWDSFVKDNRPQLIHYGDQYKVAPISPEIWGKAEDWYVIGDIHGDFFAFFNALKYILRANDYFKIVLLGDLVDRGPHPLECLWLILNLVAEYDKRILWLAGNHDVGIVPGKDGSFASLVSDANFVVELNKIDSWTPFRREFGREYIELVQDLPRAALSPDGTLFTHGGFPLVDLHKELSEKTTVEEKMTWLNSDKALQDFTWTRITNEPKKRPNRHSKGASYGYTDFEKFCDATKDFFPVKRLVTGHEHPAGGVDELTEWKTQRALTLKGFGFDGNHYEHPDAFNAGYQDHLVIGRCRTNDIPEIIRIPVDRDDLTQFFDMELARYFPKLPQG